MLGAAAGKEIVYQEEPGDSELRARGESRFWQTLVTCGVRLTRLMLSRSGHSQGPGSLRAGSGVQ